MKIRVSVRADETKNGRNAKTGNPWTKRNLVMLDLSDEKPMSATFVAVDNRLDARVPSLQGKTGWFYVESISGAFERVELIGEFVQDPENKQQAKAA